MKRGEESIIMSTRKREDKFPLWLHPIGQWCKKLRGKFHYFGTDKDAALKRYANEWDDIKAGRTPRRDKVSVVTVAHLVNTFLTVKREKVDSGELTAAMWGEYHRACERIVGTFGRDRVISDLRPADFGKLRAATSKKLGPVALSKFITMTKTAFAFAYSDELIGVPLRYGDRFDKPPKRVMRLEKHRKGTKLIPAADLIMLIDHADAQLRAMIYLGLNAGFGQADCARLQRQALELSAGWLDFPRPKSGVARRVPLWPETVAALVAVHPIRPEPKDPADGGCVFITNQVNRWCCYRDPGNGKRGHNLDAVARSFRRLCHAADVEVPGGPYSLRQVFRTVADEVKDRPAIDLIMGHADHSMAAYYREEISDDRLRAVTDHVRQWLLAGRRQMATSPTLAK
jgi:integrase